MSEGDNLNTLVNIGQSKISENFYNDLASPGMKKMGQALATVLDVGNTILWPVRWANERTRMFFENNLKKYQRRMDAIEDEKIIEVPSELAVPILERFQYVSNESLSDAFVTLLASASSSDTVASAHPGFVHVIDRLAPDEAKIMKYFSENRRLGAYTSGWYVDEHRKMYSAIFEQETLITELLPLSFPDNADIYFDNLTSLGLIEKTDWYEKPIEHQFDQITRKYAEILKAKMPEFVSSTPLPDAYKYDRRHMYRITPFGLLFCNACVSN